MFNKDYYKILEVLPGSSGREIKRSYRKLALKYHPDRNPGSLSASNFFREVQEAYEVLSDPQKREQYHYEFYHSTNGKMNFKAPSSPMEIFAAANELARQVAKLDFFRMNHEAVFERVLQILSDSNIEILNENNDPLLNQHIVQEILYSIRPLKYDQIQEIGMRLALVARAENELIKKVHQFVRHKRAGNFWERLLPVLVIVITLVLCWLIYASAR